MLMETVPRKLSGRGLLSHLITVVLKVFCCPSLCPSGSTPVCCSLLVAGLAGSWQRAGRAMNSLSPPPSQRSEPWVWYRFLLKRGGEGEVLRCDL